MRIATRREEQLRATDGAVQLTLVERDCATREEAEHRPLFGRRGTLERADPVADGLPRHGRVLPESCDERIPALLGPCRLEAVDEAAARVDQDERRLICGAESSRERALRILDRSPLPAVPADEGASPVGRVRGVQSEEVEALALLGDPACVGDRLAIARASPGRPDVDDDRLPAELAERETLAVERRPGDRRRGLRRRRCRRDRDESEQRAQAEHETPSHEPHRSRGTLWKRGCSDFVHIVGAPIKWRLGTSDRTHDGVEAHRGRRLRASPRSRWPRPPPPSTLATRVAGAGRCRSELGDDADRAVVSAGLMGPDVGLVPSGGAAHPRRAARRDPSRSGSRTRAARSRPIRHDARARRAARRSRRPASVGAHHPARGSRRGARADRHARHGDGRAAPRAAAQPPVRERAARAARRAAGFPRRGRVLARRSSLTLEQLACQLDPAARGRVRRSRRSPTGSAPILARALRFVGYPYVFSGRSEKTQKLWSASAPGGHDRRCPAASTARGSSGGSTSSSRSQTLRCSPGCSRDGRRTR